MGYVTAWSDLAHKGIYAGWLPTGFSESFASDQLFEYDHLCGIKYGDWYADYSNGGICALEKELSLEKCHYVYDNVYDAFSGGIIPLYLVVTQLLGWHDSRLSIILPSCVSAFNLIIVRTAISSVPQSLEESARIDGADQFTILFKIILPLIKPTMATIILYYAVGHWNSWFHASIFLTTRAKFPLQLVLKEILISGDISSTTTISSADFAGDTILYKQIIKYCTIVLSSAPIFVFYPFIQKYFESGVMVGAIKE